MKKAIHQLPDNGHILSSVIFKFSSIIPASRDVDETYDLLWNELLNKAQDPVNYVPQILECKIVSDVPGDCLHRIITRHDKTIEQHIYDDKESGTVVFVHFNDEQTFSITNELIKIDDKLILFIMSTEFTGKESQGIFTSREQHIESKKYFEKACAAVTQILVQSA